MFEPAKKPLKIEWSKRADKDVEQIERYYLEQAGEAVSDAAVDAIYWQADKIAGLRLKMREGQRGTRECVMKTYPYTIVYQIGAQTVRIVRVLHQRREYFNRPK